jgi:phytoene dehydrogenase-like protein
MTSRFERQIERFAPGFHDLVLARRVMSPAALEEHNPNLIGGDINGGSNAPEQFVARPFPRRTPYTTSNPRRYLCSSSTPPGGAAHLLCGCWVARTALRPTFNKDVPEQLAG